MSYRTENTADSGWEQQRRTNRFAIEPYTTEDTNAWLSQLGLPMIEHGEPITDWKDRVVVAKKAGQIGLQASAEIKE
jgi:hypothetical protein